MVINDAFFETIEYSGKLKMFLFLLGFNEELDALESKILNIAKNGRTDETSNNSADDKIRASDVVAAFVPG